jgi:hypothetical protein
VLRETVAVAVGDGEPTEHCLDRGIHLADQRIAVVT